MEIFGFNINRVQKEHEDNKTVKTFTQPEFDDGSISVAGHTLAGDEFTLDLMSKEGLTAAAPIFAAKPFFQLLSLLPSVFGRSGGITNAMPGTGSSGNDARGVHRGHAASAAP